MSPHHVQIHIAVEEKGQNAGNDNDATKQRWDQVIVLQVTCKSQDVALKFGIKTGKFQVLNFEF